jgi:LacI family transcriptional regulator
MGTLMLATMRENRLTRQAIVVDGDYTEATAHSVALELLTTRRPPSAVFAANDASAFGMLSAGRSVRLAVPEKLSVIGFDNTTMAQSEFVGSPPSTTPQGDG